MEVANARPEYTWRIEGISFNLCFHSIYHGEIIARVALRANIV